MDIVRLSPRLTLVRNDLPSDPDIGAREIRMQMRDAGGLSGHYGAAEPRDWRIHAEPARTPWWVRAAQRFLAIWRWRATQ